MDYAQQGSGSPFSFTDEGTDLTHTAQARPIWGPVLTRNFRILATIALITGALVLYRFLVGLGPVTGMTDSYPWGIWKLFNVIVMTSLASGGYAMALLILLAGAVYRLDATWITYSPGDGWMYFPSTPELLITFGLIATQVLLYSVIVKRFPILESMPLPKREPKPKLVGAVARAEHP